MGDVVDGLLVRRITGLVVFVGELGADPPFALLISISDNTFLKSYIRRVVLYCSLWKRSHWHFVMNKIRRFSLNNLRIGGINSRFILSIVFKIDRTCFVR
jgi:hypothetical protein